VTEGIDFSGIDGEGEYQEREERVPDPPRSWFVRIGGRRSGPFDAERLRILARRGALTRVHSVSADGRNWTQATSLRDVFNEDGSVVIAGKPSFEEPADEEAGFDSIPDASIEFPYPMVRPALGAALVRPVVIAALLLGAAMLAMPTSRDDAGALAWWWSEGAADIAVRGLCAVALLGGGVTVFLAPEPVRASSVAAVAAVLAAAASLGLMHAPWAVFAVLLVPAAAMLVALDASGSAGVRAIGVGSLAVSAAVGISAVLSMVSPRSGWALCGAALAAAGSVALGVSGVRALRCSGPNASGVFKSSVAAAVGGLGAAFVSALGALIGPEPMTAAKAAVTSCLVLAFSAVSWASVHEAVESSHLLPRASDDDAADEAHTQA
jgi:hypothetical protein